MSVCECVRAVDGNKLLNALSGSGWGPFYQKLADLFNKVNVCLLLLYAIATADLLYHGHDVMHKMRRRKPEPTYTCTDSRDL